MSNNHELALENFYDSHRPRQQVFYCHDSFWVGLDLPFPCIIVLYTPSIKIGAQI